MPFKNKGGGKYKSPSGRTFTKKQVVAYYATDGFSRPVKNKGGKKLQRAQSRRKG